MRVLDNLLTTSRSRVASFFASPCCKRWAESGTVTDGALDIDIPSGVTLANGEIRLTLTPGTGLQILVR